MKEIKYKSSFLEKKYIERSSASNQPSFKKKSKKISLGLLK